MQVGMGRGDIATCDLPIEQREHIIGFSPACIPFGHMAVEWPRVVNVNVCTNLSSRNNGKYC